MFESGLNCQACHIFHDVSEETSIFGDVSMATYESCDICHGSGYNKLLINWKVLMDKKIHFLDSLYNEVVNETNSKEEGDDKEHAKLLIYDAKYNFEMELSRNWHWMWSKFYFNKKHYSYSMALLIVFPSLITSMIKFFYYFVTSNKFKKKIYIMRFLGLLNSIFGKKSWYRPKI